MIEKDFEKLTFAFKKLKGYLLSLTNEKHKLSEKDLIPINVNLRDMGMAIINIEKRTENDELEVLQYNIAITKLLEKAEKLEQICLLTGMSQSCITDFLEMDLDFITAEVKYRNAIQTYFQHPLDYHQIQMNWALYLPKRQHFYLQKIN